MSELVPVFIEPDSQLPEISYALEQLLALENLRCQIQSIRASAPDSQPLVYYGATPPPAATRCLHIRPAVEFWHSVAKLQSRPPNLSGQIRQLLKSSETLSAPRADEQGFHFEFDAIALAFALLTRLEEYVVATRDEYDRFPLRSSALAGSLPVPHVNLIARKLSDCWRTLGALPAPVTPEPRFTFSLSHDIDHLRLYGRFTGELRTAASLLYRRRDLRAVSQLAWGSLRARLSAPRDPYDTLDYLMDQAERVGALSLFFFMTERSHARDGGYDPASPHLSAALQRVAARGHRIGLHGSFTSFDDAASLSRQKRRLEELAGRPVTAIRQHYLRWRTPQTARAQVAAGFTADYTLGFAEAIGFRSGCATPVQIFDCTARRTLAVTEYGTHIMDVSLFEPHYCGWGFEQALAECTRLIDAVAAVGGHLVLLWHNSSLNDVLTPGWKRFYEDLVATVVSRGGRSA